MENFFDWIENFVHELRDQANDLWLWDKMFIGMWLMICISVILGIK